MPLYPAHRVVATAGRSALRRVWLRQVAGDGSAQGPSTAIDCDLLAVSGGWNPALALFAQAQGRLRFDERLAAFVPGAIDAAVECVGAARGSFALRACLAEGAAAGARAAALCGFADGDAAAAGGRGQRRQRAGAARDRAVAARPQSAPLSICTTM